MQADYELQDRAQPSNTRSKPPEPEASPVSAQTSITVREPVTTSLKGSVYALLAVALYSILALVSWVLICITSFKPIRDEPSYYSISSSDPRESFRYNEKTIKGAEILRTVTTLLTIPVTSAICSMAFVVYMQSGGMGRSLNVRQLMALADQGWISPRIWVRIIKAGSVPLYVAFIVTVIGSVAQILQTSFVDRETVRVPVTARYYNPVIVKDIPSMFASDDTLGREKGHQVYSLRSMLDTVSPYDVDAHLWGYIPRGDWKLSILDISDTYYWRARPDPYPFFSELPSNFSTGLFGRQYAPRMNSTTNVTELSEGDFTKGCQNSTDNGGFYVKYQKTYGYVERDYTRFALTACMPGDKRYSPWLGTRNRQDITEELYLNVTLQRVPRLFKITTNSSLGYFELPSLSNNQAFGPLLDKDPYPNGKPSRSSNYLLGNSKRDDARNVSDSGNSTLITVANPGPLTLLADALFGNGSFIETRIRTPEAFIETRANFNGDTRRPNTWMCKAIYPLVSTLRGGCVTESETFGSADGPIWSWLGRLTSSDKALQTSMIYGVWASTKNWLGPHNRRFNDRETHSIYYSEGFESFKPKISVEKRIVGSVLLAIHLVGLWALALIATFISTWTNTLGAEAMVKVGMAHAVPLSTAEKAWKQEAGRLPGYIGDARPGSDVGRLEMGAKTSLTSKRTYELLR